MISTCIARILLEPNANIVTSSATNIVISGRDNRWKTYGFCLDNNRVSCSIGEDERMSCEPMWLAESPLGAQQTCHFFRFPLRWWSLNGPCGRITRVCTRVRVGVYENTGSPGAGHPPSVAESPLLRRVRLVKLEEGILRTGNILLGQTRIISHLAWTIGDEWKEMERCYK